MKYLTRQGATAYLREHGLTCGSFLLAQLAMTGDGPQFRYWGRRPIYTEDNLDKWIESRLGAPVRVTSGVRRHAGSVRSRRIARRRRKQPAPQSLSAEERA